MQETSKDAYFKLKDSGALSRSEQEVMVYVEQFGPATANELFRMAKGVSHVVSTQFHARLNELLKKGLVKINQRRYCKVTGIRVIEWAVTNEKL